MYELAKNVKWYLIWRGCVETEGKYYLNDVSLMPDGSFYTTHMFEEDFPLYKWILANYLKFNTGFVVKWSQKWLPRTETNRRFISKWYCCRCSKKYDGCKL